MKDKLKAQLEKIININLTEVNTLAGKFIPDESLTNNPNTKQYIYCATLHGWGFFEINEKEIEWLHEWVEKAEKEEEDIVLLARVQCVPDEKGEWKKLNFYTPVNTDGVIVCFNPNFITFCTDAVWDGVYVPTSLGEWNLKPLFGEPNTCKGDPNNLDQDNYMAG